MKKWEINQAVGRYIRSHEEVQRISIRDRLNDFMQVYGAELAARSALRHAALTRLSKGGATALAGRR